MSEKIANQNSQPESKRTEKIDLPPLNTKFEGWMHQFEYDYLKANHKLIHEYLNDLSFLPTECDGVIGGVRRQMIWYRFI